MAKTKRGIYHNLQESEYATSNTEVAFFFSSRFYLEKFLEEYFEYRVNFRIRLSKTMKVDNMNTDLLADIHLYKDIEKRGFRVNINTKLYMKTVGHNPRSNKGDLLWLEIQKYALVKMTSPSSNDWYEIPVLKSDEQRTNME